MDSFSVVIPARNEQGNIGRLVDETVSALADEQADYEIVVVNDFSTDGTAQDLDAARERHPQLRVVSLDQPGGQSAALWTGVRTARHPWIVTLDGDGQNDPKDIIKLMRTSRDSVADGAPPVLVAGLRMNRRDPAGRRWFSWTTNRVSALVLGHPVMDVGCGLKVFPRDLFLALPPFDHMHRFLPACFGMFGTKVLSVPVSHRARLNGSSNYTNLNRTIENIIDVLAVRWLRARYLAPRLYPALGNPIDSDEADTI